MRTLQVVERRFSKARQSVRHAKVPPLFAEPGWNLHTPEEIGIDNLLRSPSPKSHNSLAGAHWGK
jgi:hypothetical protein